MKRYPVKEMFLTIQGEGHHAGRRAVFIRMAGCNIWSGREQDRARDSVKGCCAAWCDTDFVGTDGVGGGRFTAESIARRAFELWSAPGDALVVLTGGEPSLFVDEELVNALHALYSVVHVETNGSRPLPPSVDWVTLSPKPPMPVVDQRYDEVKVIYPAVDPPPYHDRAPLRYVQPLDSPERADNTRRCVEFVMAHPEWRLSLQAHKALGIP